MKLRIMKSLAFVLTAAMAVPLTACGGSSTPAAGPTAPTMISPAKGTTIIEIATEAGSFNTLLTALDAADLTATLEGDGPFTVFAPTDAAFAALPEGVLDGLLADKEKLKEVLTFHVVSGAYSSKDIAAKTSLTSLQGGELTIDTTDGIKVNGATVEQADVAAGNGKIHVINAVLMPSM